MQSRRNPTNHNLGKLLVICGPTSTGKTTLAVSLAQKFNGEIISADSRQVYKKLDIGTGKDLPKGAKIRYSLFAKYGYYEVGGIKIWGYDLADPRHGFSVSQYLKFAERMVGDIRKRGKLPILTGGTGLYIKGVIDGIPTAKIPNNLPLRKNLEEKKPEELFEMLAKLDSIKAGQMNLSDRKNPRRLVRAIEVATWKMENAGKERGIEKKRTQQNVLEIGLTASDTFINQNISSRIKDRLKEGIKNEIARLLKSHVDWDMQSMSSMGYRQWKDYFEGKKPESFVIKEWSNEEIKYVKRQMVWFKKDKRIVWFDITNRDYVENVEKMVKKWHNTG